MHWPLSPPWQEGIGHNATCGAAGLLSSMSAKIQGCRVAHRLAYVNKDGHDDASTAGTATLAA